MIKNIKIKNVCLCFKSETTMALDIGYLFVTSIR